MPILPRYFLRLYLPAFGLCLGLFTGILLMNYFVRLFNLAVLKGISLWWIAGCFARLLPYFFSLAIPMAFLVALLLTLGQLSEGGELMALRASGYSFVQMTWPFLALGSALSLLLLLFNHKVSPEGFHSFRERQIHAAQLITGIEIEPKTFIKLGKWRLYAEEVDKDSGELKDAYLLRSGRKAQGIRIDARKGRIMIQKGQGVALELEDGSMQLPNDDPTHLTTASFKRYRLFVPLASSPHLDRTPDIPEMNSRELKRRVSDPKTGFERRLEYVVEIAVRSAVALSPFVFFWIGAPLGMNMGRHSKGKGFALSLAILFLFYGLLALGIGLGRRNEAIASLAPWMANAVGLTIGLYLTRRSLAR